MIKLLKFYKEIRAGSSLPLIVGGSDGKRYVVKPSGSGEGVQASIVEWLAIKLGRLLGIPVLDPIFLMIDAGFAQEAGDPEIIELLEKSAGANFGTKFFESAIAFDQRDASRIDESLKRDVFLYDLFLLNIDRNARNPNMVFKDGELLCLDYSSSVTIRNCVDGKSYREQAFLPHIKMHPFYCDEIDASGFIKKIKAVRDKSVRDIVNGLPEEWLHRANVGKGAKKVISDRLIDKRNHAESLIKSLEELRDLKAETEEERLSRILKNKEAFERIAGKL